jgi:hypothetical protein
VLGRGVNGAVLLEKEIGLYGLARLCNKFHSGQAGPAHQSYLQGYDVACACQGGGCVWGKNGKAEKYIAFPAYILELRWRWRSLVESRLGSNLRRNRFEGLQALSSPWELWYGQSQKVEITVHCYICCLLGMAPSLAIGAEAMALFVEGLLHGSCAYVQANLFLV